MCDMSFKEDMDILCTRSYNRKFDVSVIVEAVRKLITEETEKCKAIAELYYRAVSLFGAGHFRAVSPTWCHRECVKDYGKPDRQLKA